MSDFNYGADRIQYNKTFHHYTNFKGINLLHGWAVVYILPWGWFPVDLTFSISKNDFLYSVNTSLISEFWKACKVVPIECVKICHEDYIAQYIDFLGEVVRSLLFYYDECAVISPRDSIERVKSFFEPLPLPWMKKTTINIKIPAQCQTLRKYHDIWKYYSHSTQFFNYSEDSKT